MNKASNGCLFFLIVVVLLSNQNFSADLIKKTLTAYHQRINRLEEEKFDLEYIVKRKDFEVRITSTRERNPFFNYFPCLTKISGYTLFFSNI